MKLIKLTSYSKHDEYTEKNKLILKGGWVEYEALVNTDQILLVFPAAKDAEVGNSVVRFLSGFQLSVKEKFDDIQNLLSD